MGLERLSWGERKQVNKFLRSARQKKVHEGYVASNRKAWWSVGLREPAPVLATYMARRPPAFVATTPMRGINIAHGLYPRQPIEARVLDNLAAHLRTAVTLAQGRTYAGGLTKFEPREMERLSQPISVSSRLRPSRASNSATVVQAEKPIQASATSQSAPPAAATSAVAISGVKPAPSVLASW